MSSYNFLKNHYDKKYSIESKFPYQDKINYVNFPRNRYQATIKYCPKGGKLLEIGAGSGEVMDVLSNSFEFLYGLELSQNRFKQLKSRFYNYNNIKIIQGNIENFNLPFAVESIDVILMVAIIEHLIDPISVIKYLHTFLKHDGYIIIDTPNIAKWTRRIKLLFGRFPSTASLDEGFLMYDKITNTDLLDEGHLHYFTYRSLKKLLITRVGFKRCFYRAYGLPICAQLLPKLFSECFIIAQK